MSTRVRNFQPNDIADDRKTITGLLAVAAVMGMVVNRKVGSTLSTQDQLELSSGKAGYFLRRDVADPAGLKAFIDADVLRPNKLGFETPYPIGGVCQAEHFDEVWVEGIDILGAGMNTAAGTSFAVTTLNGQIIPLTHTATQETLGIVRENIPAVNTASPARRFLIEIRRAPLTAPV